MIIIIITVTNSVDEWLEKLELDLTVVVVTMLACNSQNNMENIVYKLKIKKILMSRYLRQLDVVRYGDK